MKLTYKIKGSQQINYFLNIDVMNELYARKVNLSTENRTAIKDLGGNIYIKNKTVLFDFERLLNKYLT